MGKKLATFAGGCFWCTETFFKELKGVDKVISGYAGGTSPNPNYYEIHSGKTGHAEAIQFTFDSKIISYDTLLDVFFGTHNPTTPNRQGNDIGEEYRSIIFYHDEAQKKSAQNLIKKIEKEKIYDSPIATELVAFTAFYPAEDYHQDYFKKNPDQPYCQYVINPKLAKFRQKFLSLLKKDNI